MGKTSPTTGTGKKAQKAIYKGQKFSVEEYVREAKHDRGAKRAAKHDIRQIGKGKYLPETDVKKLTKQYQQAYKGTEGMFDKQAEEALHKYQTQIAPSVAQQFGGSEVGTSSALRQALSASGADLQRSLASDFANLRHGIASGTMNQSNQNTLAGLNTRLQAHNMTMGNPISPIGTQVQNSYNQPQQGQPSGLSSALGGAAQGGGSALTAWWLAKAAAAPATGGASLAIPV